MSKRASSYFRIVVLPFSELHVSLDGDIALIQMRRGQNGPAVEFCRRLFAKMNELPQTQTLEDLRAAIYADVAIASGVMGQYSEALRKTYKEETGAAERAGARTLVATCWLNVADEYFKQGDIG